MTLVYPGVHLLLMVVGLGFGFINGAHAAGAGRAFPIDSENYVIKEFQRINPNLEWDRTNFLTDLSGQYANCDSIDARGKIAIGRETPEGDSIAGYNDHKDGTAFHVNAVNDDLKIVIDRWIETRVLHQQIVTAKRFGCSVRPGCSGHVAVNCLFSPAADGNWPTRPSATPQNSRSSATPHNFQPSTTPHNFQPSTTPHNFQPSTTPHNFQPSTTPQNIRSSTASRNIQPVYPHPVARALTKEQHKVAERIVNNTWDDTHFLENLSGLETNCTMIGHAHWPFTQAETHKHNGTHIIGRYGYAVNNGTTEGPLVKILQNLGQNMKVNSTSRFGCSLISDCRLPNETLYVVASCIFRH